jgi:glycosyltransferase involved in cell wall biosynthesis
LFAASATRSETGPKLAKITLVTNPAESKRSPPQVAIAIPCFNEAAAIAIVIEQFREALPEAQIVVFDNNSTDRTAEIARGKGARVIAVPRQGKGHAVRAAFATLTEFDVVVLSDGDGTYPAQAAGLLVGPVIDDAADMAVGARRPAPGAGALSRTRGAGNLLIRAAFRLLIGTANRDLLSGYRAFNRRFRQAVELRTTGFEIETELASEAVAQRLRVVEIDMPYYPRIAGTQSKLHAIRDGCRILVTILVQSLRLRPHRPLLVWLVSCAVLAFTVHWGFAAAAGFGVMAGWSILLGDVRARRRERRDKTIDRSVDPSL